MLKDTHALCIGIADYQHIRPLSKSPLHDAADIAALLADPARGGYRPDYVRLVLNGEATRAGILAALDELSARTSPDSTVFLFFAGHGGRLTTGAQAGEYLLPIDARLDSAEALAGSALSTAELAERLRQIRARKLLVGLDCCHAGGLCLRGEPGEPTVEFRSGIPPAAQALLSQGRGRALLLAARADEGAAEKPGDRNGLFTKHLLAGLRGGAVCTGGLVRVFDLFQYVQRHVQAERPGQHPVFKAELEENFPVVHCSAPPVILPSTLSDGFRYDVFMHALERGVDRQWLRSVLRPALERRGLHSHDADRFQLGVPRIKQLEQAVVQSRYTLAVLSEAYVQSGLAEMGDLIAQHLGAEQSQYRLLAVLREPCIPRLGIRMAPVLDLSIPDELEAQLDRLAESIRQPPPRL